MFPLVPRIVLEALVLIKKLRKMAPVIDLVSPIEDIQFLTERPMPGSFRSRSRTIGRDSKNAGGHVFESVAPDEIIDLTFENSAKTGYSLEQGEFPLASIRANDELLCAGDCVEIESLTLGQYKVSLLMIELITQDRGGDTSIRGLPIARNLDLLGKLPKKANEVCRILQYDDSESKPNLVRVSKIDIVKKRKLVFTNGIYPRHCSGNHLVCRWDFKVYTITKARSSRPVEEVLQRTQASDVQSQHFQADEVLCQAWRGGRVAGGSWLGDSRRAFPVGTVDLDVELDGPDNPTHPTHPTHRQPGQKYTVFDSFSGAGGVSRGAQMGGFKVTHAVDMAEEVWATYRTNFRDVMLYKSRIDEFIVQARTQHIRVDVLHLSPPCQYFSPAHTHPSAHDDKNIFALYSCNALINKVRPRLITVEQTFGILQERHQHYFRGFINDFTQYGYSVRWKVVRLCTWGLAQDRKRLIMIAAAPGEKLPPFPTPTHSETGHRHSLRPFTTIRKALSGVRRGDNLHNLDTVRRHEPRKPSYDPDRLSGTLTTGGAELPFFNGRRDFTLREMATLQGFPKYHRFEGTKTSVKRQIGNAFAPNTVKVLYQHLEGWLLKQDDVLPYQAIIIDDSDEVPSRDPSSASKSGSPEMIDLVSDEMDIDDGRRANSTRPRSYDSADSVMIDLT